MHGLTKDDFSAAAILDKQKRGNQIGPGASAQAQGRQVKRISAGRSFIPAGNNGISGAEVDGEFLGHKLPVCSLPQSHKATETQSFLGGKKGKEFNFLVTSRLCGDVFPSFEKGEATNSFMETVLESAEYTSLDIPL
jgi:hypothetical protein